MGSRPDPIDWRFIDSGFAPAKSNMAFDEELFNSFINDNSESVFRIYGWEPKAVSLGFSQNIDDIADTEKCRSDGIDVVKRMTGGGALFHSGEITYSMVLSGEPFRAMTAEETYEATTAFLIHFYKSLGLDASYWGTKSLSKKIDASGFCLAGREKYDIVINGKKIGGNAQKRHKGVIFQHGSIPMDSSFREARKYIRGADTEALEKSVSLSELGLKLSFDDAKEKLRESFEDAYAVRFKKSGRPSIPGTSRPEVKLSPAKSASGGRLPEWLNKKVDIRSLTPMKKILAGRGLNTICVESLCPNISECFSRGRATFMILGDACTRGCLFCGVRAAKPLPPDADEAARVAAAVSGLGLKHVVVTSPTRDDLSGGGASFFAQAVKELRKISHSLTIELLIPDFAGDEESFLKVAATAPDIIGHNMETVRELYHIRKGADYDRSLNVLERIAASGIKAKSGFMLGLGETETSVIGLIKDIRRSGAAYLSIGQYLMPSKKAYPVKKYVPAEEFEYYKIAAYKEGFAHVESAPYVRSSYMAENYSSFSPKKPNKNQNRPHFLSFSLKILL
ncbi:lipoyl synthase [bacterium]|nr:lipoyl synthase [bacterium]MBU3929504.1 lipoyl synthase [bacterium]MBU4122715.1 lipoyl synthase [bacterium]